MGVGRMTALPPFAGRCLPRSRCDPYARGSSTLPSPYARRRVRLPAWRQRLSPSDTSDQGPGLFVDVDLRACQGVPRQLSTNVIGLLTRVIAYDWIEALADRRAQSSSIAQGDLARR